MPSHCLDAPRRPIDFFQIANLQVPFYRSFLIKIVYFSYGVPCSHGERDGCIMLLLAFDAWTYVKLISCEY